APRGAKGNVSLRCIAARSHDLARAWIDRPRTALTGPRAGYRHFSHAGGFERWETEWRYTWTILKAHFRGQESSRQQGRNIYFSRIWRVATGVDRDKPAAVRRPHGATAYIGRGRKRSATVSAIHDPHEGVEASAQR